MEFLDRLRAITPDVLTGNDAAPYGRDWIGRYLSTPLAVARPATTDEVSRIMALAMRLARLWFLWRATRA